MTTPRPETVAGRALLRDATDHPIWAQAMPSYIAAIEAEAAAAERERIRLAVEGRRAQDGESVADYGPWKVATDKVFAGWNAALDAVLAIIDGAS